MVMNPMVISEKNHQLNKHKSKLVSKLVRDFSNPILLIGIPEWECFVEVVWVPGDPTSFGASLEFLSSLGPI